VVGFVVFAGPKEREEEEGVMILPPVPWEVADIAGRQEHQVGGAGTSTRASPGVCVQGSRCSCRSLLWPCTDSQSSFRRSRPNLLLPLLLTLPLSLLH